MKSLSSALIMSDNFIVSATLSSMLRKMGVQKIYETNSHKNSFSDIQKSTPEFIFFDLKNPENHSLETVIQLRSLSNAQVGVLTSSEYSTEWEHKLINHNDILVLSKPISLKEIEHFLTRKNAEFFFGKVV